MCTIEDVGRGSGFRVECYRRAFFNNFSVYSVCVCVLVLKMPGALKPL